MGIGLASRPRTAVPAGVFAVGAGAQVALSARPDLGDPAPVLAGTLAVLAIPVVLGCLVGTRVPDGQVGAALAWVGAAPAAVFAVELWGETDLTSSPWPGAHAVYLVKLGAWVWNLAGFAALCLVFPSGLAPGPRWRAVAWTVAAAGVAVNAAVSWTAANRWDGPAETAAVLTAFGVLLAALGAAVLSLVVRYRRGTETTRTQLRWLVLGAGSVPVLLACGWAAQTWWDASNDVAYSGFLLAMLVAVPAAVVVAVLRHDLFDVDRLLGSSLAWLLTSLASAAVFACVGYAAGSLLGADARLGVSGAAFVAALALPVLHRQVNDRVGRLVDRERFVLDARVRDFVRDVRDGTAQPETVEAVLQDVLGDPELRLLVRLPDGPPGEYVGLSGEAAVPAEGRTRIPLRTGEIEVGVIVLGATSARRLRRARHAAVQARLPIEVTRLRLELRAALAEVRTSRARLLSASARERRQLERDLHDGAQQQIVAAGMRLRSVQRGLRPGTPEHRDLDAVVETLEATVGELRRLAHGVRPARLDDGLAAALGALVAASPVEVRLSVPGDVRVDEVAATTAYYVVAEAYANALKHADAATVTIRVDDDGGVLRIMVADDGVGGARGALGSVRDRVASAGGDLAVSSPPGGGTLVEVSIPHADRGGR
ncbi:sensor histidine kinase [Actinomadura chibensis]|uniref:histidine kinase n=1 Tax=Actinomadura chibensis TaxID=392828 RepID=A0A5D0NI99_9ACTN|nr:histidine kinase [Actinomadura chibensis]TYB44088.1 sensor histidine kinase [Actinomadura chibensis]